jgi:hypothetical protein
MKLLFTFLLIGVVSCVDLAHLIPDKDAMLDMMAPPEENVDEPADAEAFMGHPEELSVDDPASADAEAFMGPPEELNADDPGTVAADGANNDESMLEMMADIPIESNLEELDGDEPSEADLHEVLVDLDEERLQAIVDSEEDHEEAMLAVMAHANPAQVKRGVALCKKMMAKNAADFRKNSQQKAAFLAKNAKQRAKIAREKARLATILRIFKSMLSGRKNLLNSKWLAQRRPGKNKVLQRGLNISSQWRLSFNLYQWRTVRNWGSLVHFTKGPNGSRLPAIWLHPNGNKLHMCMLTGRSSNDCWNSGALTLRKWHHVVMMQKKVGGKFWLTYWIDGKKKATKPQTKPQSFKNVLLYSADPWYASPFAYVKNLKMVNL